MNAEELPSSDSSDEDYIPDETKEQEVSEENDSDEIEKDVEEEDTKSTKKRSKSQTKSKKRRKKLNKSKNEEEIPKELTEEEIKLKEAKEKERLNDLWSDFLSDVKESESKSKKIVSKEDNDLAKHTAPEVSKTKKITVTQVYDFAGEEVRITKVVEANSKEAKNVAKQNEKKTEPTKLPYLKPTTSTDVNPPSGLPVLKKPAGLSNLMNMLGEKKTKMGILDKSNMDWQGFKKAQGIAEELQIHNRGKQGFLERQDFLQRTDHRQFEIERDLRTVKRSNR